MSPRGGNRAEVNSVQSIVWCPSVTPALNKIISAQSLSGQTFQNLLRSLEGLPSFHLWILSGLLFILPAPRRLVSLATSTSRLGDTHADSHNSMLMLQEDKSSGHLWPKWQLHSAWTLMSETVDILKQFQGLLATVNQSVTRTQSAGMLLAPCHQVHYVALNMKCGSLDNSRGRMSITTKASIYFSFCLFSFLSLLYSPS